MLEHVLHTPTYEAYEASHRALAASITSTNVEILSSLVVLERFR
jgi:hypothetical protein